MNGFLNPRFPSDAPPLDQVEYATLEYVDRFNHRRLLEPIGDIPPAEKGGQLPSTAHLSTTGRCQIKRSPADPGWFKVVGSTCLFSTRMSYWRSEMVYGNWFRTVRLIPLLVAMTVILAACAEGDTSSQTTDEGATDEQGTVERIRERGTLRVGAECLYKGTCFLDPDTGERLGYGVDVTNILAADLGVDVEWVDMEWTALIPAIQTGQVDMITQGMTRTPERAFAVTFTDPMEYYPQALVLNSESELLELENLDEVIVALNQPDRTITFLLGGAHQIIVENSFPRAQHRGLESAQAFEEVATGRADAMIADTGDAWDYMQNNPRATIWQMRAISTHQGSFVISYGDLEFLTWLNNWVAYYTANGTLRNLKLAWNQERGIPADLAGLPPAGAGR